MDLYIIVVFDCNRLRRLLRFRCPFPRLRNWLRFLTRFVV